MVACKIIFVILVSCYYCRGHFIFRNYKNQQSPGLPSLNFRTFPEYFKPSFRSQNLPPLSRVDNSLLQGTNINNQRAQFNEERGNGMLSMIKKMLKPLMWNLENPRWVVKKPTHGRGTNNDNYHGLHLKLIPKLVKKEVAKQLETILGKRPTDKLLDNTRQELNKTTQEKNTPEANDFLHKKDNISTAQPVLNETSPHSIQETGYINKIEAKSIFGNFVGNKHFANIFVFYPNNNDSPLVVELKDNLTDVVTQNPAEITTKQPIDKFIDEITEKQKEENKQTEEGDNNLAENNVVDANNDNADSSIKDNVIAPDETIVTTENIFKTPNFTITTTDIIPNNDNVSIVDIVTENSNEDDKHTDGDQNDLVGKKDKEDNKVEDESENTLVEKYLEPTEIIMTEENIKTTEDFLISNTEVSATTEQLYTNGYDFTGTTLVNEPTENLTEKPNNVQGGIDNENKIEQEEFDDLVKEKDAEQTVVSATYTTEEATEESNITTTEVSMTTENNVEFTDVTESKGDVASENTTEFSDTLTTADDESTTQFVTENIEGDFKNSTTDVNDTTEDDYLEIEYTYF